MDILNKRTNKLMLGLIVILLILAIVLIIVYSNKNISKNIESFYDPTPEDELNNNINELNQSISSLNTTINLQPTYSIDNEGEVYSIILNDVYGNSIRDLNSLNNNIDNKINDEKITNLENELKDLEKEIIKNYQIRNEKDGFSVIKSHNNGQEFCLYYDDKTVINDVENKVKKTGYLVNLNNGCLSVGPDDYGVYQCNSKNPKQYFKIVNIYNDEMYKNNIDKSINYKDELKLDDTKYPFVLMKSANNDNCLTNNHGYLTVQPCTNLVSQRWTALK